MSRAPNSRPQNNKQSNHGSTLIGVFIGLVIGVLIAAALAWYFSRPYEFQRPNGGLPSGPQSMPNGGGPIPLGGKPGDKPPPPPPAPPAKPPVGAAASAPPAAPGASAPQGGKEDGLTFYDLLPKGDQAAMPSAKPDAGTPAPAGDKFYLQLGAFADPSQVDNVKAQLALMGIEASVQRIESPDKGTLHRVRVGPYLKPEDMNAIRAQLTQAGIETTVVKVKPKEAPAAAPAAR